MREDFYASRLARHGKVAVVPGFDDCDLVDGIIFDELTQGVIRDASRVAYLKVIQRLADAGAEAVVLACTEIGLLIEPSQSPLPIIDSAHAHATELGRLALAVAA